MNKSISFFILVSLTLVLGLAGAIALVQSGQDSRSSASFITSGTLNALPVNSNVKVGDEFKINFAVENTTATVNTFQVTACYDSTKIKLIESKTTTGDFLPDIKQALTINSKPCYTIVGHITNGTNAPLINLASLTFQALTEGTGTIEVLKDADRTGVAGVNTADDKIIAMTAINGANYTITAASANVCTSGAKQCSGNILQKCNTALTGWETDIDCGAIGCNATTKACNTAACTNGTKECVSGNNQIRECVNNAWVVTNCNSNQYCDSSLKTCVIRASTDATLDMKIAFAGVKPGNDQCATDLWSTSFRVVNESSTNLVSGKEWQLVVKKTTETNTRGEIIYLANIVVPQANIPASGVGSVLAQGQKHLWVKYGQDRQVAWYNDLRGLLKIQSGYTLYDFSNYPLITGDVNGDGKINGQDYSLIKEKSQPITTGDQGVDLFGDIDGNCQVNAGDVKLIKESLIEINGQTY